MSVGLASNPLRRMIICVSDGHAEGASSLAHLLDVPEVEVVFVVLEPVDTSLDPSQDLVDRVGVSLLKNLSTHATSP
jgi:hypothetical protein